MNELVNILNQVLGNYIVQRDEYLFHCPFCSHAKKKLSVNIRTGRWKCWVCNEAGWKLLGLFRKLNASKEQIRELSVLLQEDLKFPEPEISQTTLFLPREYKSLALPTNAWEYKHAMKYLNGRNVTASDIIKHNIGYCDSGPYQGRIIVPSYDAFGKLNFFVSRSYYPDNFMAYKNPAVSKNVVGFENHINWQEPIILVEGVFDAMAIKRNSIPLFGKTISPKLEHEIVANNVRNIYLSLDKDALKQSLRIAERLINDGRNVYIVELGYKDPSATGFLNVVELIKKSIPLTFSKFMSLKLSLIGNL